MATSNLEQYRVADVLEWFEKKQLQLNPVFQRRSVWSPAAKSYLIDTLLRQLSIPKIYLRTKVDLITKRSHREVVDGQQRLRAIIDFARNELTLTSRAAEFKGMKYADLSDEIKERFLSYSLSIEQLINASDSDILEIFSRLNSYTVSLNPPEKRHAEFNGEFKWAVHKAATRWLQLWDEFQVVSVKERVRMLDDSLFAEMFGVIQLGVNDGGQANITKIYTKLDKTNPLTEVEIEDLTKKVDSTLKFIIDKFEELLRASSSLKNAPHFLMLFAAVAHMLHGIPEGQINGAMPKRPPVPTKDNIEVIKQNLVTIEEIISSPEAANHLVDFWQASSATTQRIRSRRIRFPIYCRAFQPQSL
jgi:Protein of unknown function DUF262